MTMISNREYYFVLSVFVQFFISTYVIENVAYAIPSLIDLLIRPLLIIVTVWMQAAL